MIRHGVSAKALKPYDDEEDARLSLDFEKKEGDDDKKPEDATSSQQVCIVA